MNDPQQSPTQKVRYGAGLRYQVEQELAELNLSQALVLATPQQVDAAEELTGHLGARYAGVYVR